MIPLRASDCIAPALRHTGRQMFKPFRLGFWLRIAVLGLLTGELSAGGGCNFNFPSPSRPSPGGSPDFPWGMPNLTPPQIAALVAFGIAAFLVLFLVMTYINSVLRFVLFDSVLAGDTRIVEGWKARRSIGRKYFVWQLLLAGVSLVMAVLLVGLPVLFLLSRGILRFSQFDPRAILYLLPGVLAFMLYSLAVAVIGLIAKDFMVPIMALEGVGWREGWMRAWQIVKATPGDYFIFYLLKIVLRIGASIAHGIVTVMVSLIFIIPAVIIVVIGVAIATGASMVVKALLITIGIAALILFIVFLVALSAFIGAPVSYFFPSYSIFFFASRYEPLGRIVYPAPPPPPPTGIPEPPPVTA